MGAIFSRLDTPTGSLLAFCGWQMALVLTIGGYRIANVLQGKAAPNSFPSDTPHGPLWYRRLIRAHLNCVENLPLFAAVVLAGKANGISSPTIDLLSQLFVLARVGQSIAHVSSGRSLAVQVRFAFFLAQYVCLGLMVAQYL